MRRILPASLLLAHLAGAAHAQQVLAPTPATVGSARGDNAGGYNIVHSFETGYRFSEVAGNRGKYRSDENFRNGIRLLGSSFAMNSRDGHGGLFDEILLNTLGLGGDPYESASLRIQKNRLYRYDMLWRLNDYYNPGLAISDARHFRDTSRRLQDHDFTLFPQSKFQLRLGYSRNNQDGPALSTVQLFDSRGDEFTPFMDVRRVWNEFRVGGDVELAGFKFSWLRAWDNFREDSRFQLGQSAGANPADIASLTGFRREEPYHGNSPLWRGNLHGEKKHWAANARLSYVGARRDFVLDENAVGVQRSAINRQTVVLGDATRPTTAGDLALSFFPNSRLSVVNNTSVYNTRIDGTSTYKEVNNALASSQIVYFQFLGIRTIANSTDVNLRVSPAVGLYAGYHYSTRLIRSTENFSFPEFPGPPEGVSARQDNRLHSGLFGVRLKPVKPLTVTLDAEVSRADRPFTPISDRNFHALRGRAQYKARTFLLSAAYRQNYNTNSVTLSNYSSHARDLAFDASWTPGNRFSLDAGYSKLHLDTVSGLAFFAAGTQYQGIRSIYVSNVHAANLGARVGIGKKADLYFGYSITKDTGDGRRAATPGGATDPIVLLLSPAETFPLSFQSPLARLSVLLSRKVRWNAGWQLYNYHEIFQLWAAPQNYHAHVGYTSVLWSF
ncbi:MAG TPA: hypothetical protein VL285_16495 [Bryobacteraceae bacterium]|nr:hypothetical protein [Bryobacteraceae bacterium]